MSRPFRTSRFIRGAFKITHAFAIISVGLVLAFVGMSLFNDGPQQAGGRFMDALARQDEKALSQLSHVSGQTPEQMEQRWKGLVEGPAKYYRFYWKIVTTTQASPESASVQMMVERDQGAASSFEEKFELPMIKVEGKWKVDLRRVDRRLYPFLPR